MPLFKKNIKGKDFLAMLRNLSATLKAGIPLVQALALIEKDLPRRRRGAFTQLRVSVERGSTLATAMGTSSWYFPPLAVNLVHAGELSGTLQQNLDAIIRHMRKSIELKRKIRGAMAYPMFVLVAIVGMGLSIGLFVLPKLVPLFDSLGVELPITTRIIIWLGTFFDQYGLVFTPLFVAGCFGLVFLLKRESVKPLFHYVLLRLPLIRVVQRQAAIAQIAGTLSTLLRSGIPIVEAIPATSQASGNVWYRRALLGTLPLIQEGRMFSEGLKRTPKLFPEMTVTLIDVGEETGTLSETLAYIEEYYEEEVDYAMKALTTAIEPLLLMFIGVIVAIFVLGVITPIYNATGSV